MPVVPFLLPADYRTRLGTLLKARALQFMVDEHRRDPRDCYVVHFDEESVLTPMNLARLVHRLAEHPVGISEGMISYGLDWDRATLVNKAMESNRPFGCHECYAVMTSPPPLHLHGSNLVIRQDLENEIGWDIGTLDGAALIAEDLVFGLSAYLRFGRGVFGWHHTEMIEQPPFTLKAAYKQRERWVFGALRARWSRSPNGVSAFARWRGSRRRNSLRHPGPRRRPRPARHLCVDRFCAIASRSGDFCISQACILRTPSSPFRRFARGGAGYRGTQHGLRPGSCPIES